MEGVVYKIYENYSKVKLLYLFSSTGIYSTDFVGQSLNILLLKTTLVAQERITAINNSMSTAEQGHLHSFF